MSAVSIVSITALSCGINRADVSLGVSMTEIQYTSFFEPFLNAILIILKVKAPLSALWSVLMLALLSEYFAEIREPPTCP
jgi:hypothetical protein